MPKKTQILIKSTLILTIAGILAKLISAFYKIPLKYLVGTEGIGYYQNVYPIYSLLTAAGLIGIPNSIAKLVAEEIEFGRRKNAHQIFKVAFIMTAITGLIATVVLYIFRNELIAITNWPKETIYALIGLSIAPMFISIAGAVRGYLQGMHNMGPTAISQVIENLFKVIVGVSLAKVLMDVYSSVPKAVGGAALGTSCGIILSAIFLCIVYFLKRNNIKSKILKEDTYVEDNLKIMKKIAYIAIPVTIASASYSIMTSIDSITISTFVEGGNQIMGMLGIVLTIINVPLVISVSLIISVVPSISAANVKKDKNELISKIKEAIEIALKLALPSAVGIFVLASPILKLVYGESEGYQYLQVLAISLIGMILAQSLNGILQGLSHYYITFTIVIFSAIIKVIANVVLVNTNLGGYGATIGTVIYYFMIIVLSYIVINKEIKFKLNMVHTLCKPIIASVIMGIVVKISFYLSYGTIKSNVLATMISISIGAIVYGIAMVMFKAFTKDELMILPMHTKIISLLEKKDKIYVRR